MTKVSISGVIVPSEWTFARQYVNAGIITPLADAVFAIASAEDDLEIVLNSYGGDVFSGNAISNAISRWAESHPKRSLTVSVDAIALSAAACILAKAPERAVRRAYRDSLVMFHSASCFTEGGPGAMKDSAELMDKVNADIMDVLLARTDLPRETVEQWLQEGRMGWLTGLECKKHGLIDKIANGLPSPKPAPLPEEEAKKGPNARISASFLKINELLTQHLKETPMPTDEQEEKQNQNSAQNEEKDQTPAQNEEKDQNEEDKDEEKKDEKEKTDDQGAANQELTDLRNQVAALEDRCQKAEAALARLTKGLGNSAGSAPAPMTFAQRVASIPANLTQAEWDDQFLALRQSHPAEFESWMKRK